MLEQAARRICRCPSPGDVQDQVGLGPRKPGLAPDPEVGAPACGKRVGTG